MSGAAKMNATVYWADTSRCTVCWPVKWTYCCIVFMSGSISIAMQSAY